MPNDPTRIALDSNPGDRGAGVIELGLALAVLLAIAGIQVGASGTARLLQHPLWLDECLSEVVANDPSFSHSMQAIARGVNHTPPTYFLLLRALRAIVGNLGPFELRTFSAMCAILAAIGVYALCRKRFDPLASMIAALAVWGHPVMVGQIFEARFYTLWAAASAWLCVFLFDDGKKYSSARWVAACAMAAIVTTVHWLGIVTVGLIWLADCLVCRPTDWRTMFRRSIPLLAGVIALLACTPFLLKQKQALIVPTWIDPIGRKEIEIAARQIYTAIPISAALVFGWLWRAAKPSRDQFRLDRFAAISGLLLFPVALLLISWIFQPVLLSRYAIVTVLPLGVMVGWLASPMKALSGRIVQSALALVLIAAGAMQLIIRAQASDVDDATFAACLDSVQQVIDHRGPLPVVMVRRHDLYPILRLRPDLSQSVALMNFDVPVDAGLTRLGKFEQQMARVDNALYPQFPLIDYSQLKAAHHFMLIAPASASVDLRTYLPGAQVRALGPDLFEIFLP